MNNKIKILHVLGSLRRGGAESFIMNMYRNLDLEKVQFDFITRGENIPEVEEEIRKKGSNIYIMPSFPRHYIKNRKAMKKFFAENAYEYQVIHVHANSLIYLLPLKLAKRYGIKIRILHSHNTQPAKPIYKWVHYMNRHVARKFATCNLACSTYAGKWMFGNRKFEVIRNAINISKFTYNEKVREKYRQKLLAGDKLVIGNVGRLVRQKNQEFLIDIFYEISKKQDALMVIIGEGELEEKLKKQVQNYGLLERVIFLQNIKDVYNYLQMMDVFVMPSLYEGLSVSLVEAQASGIGIVMSDTVTQETVLVEENIQKVSLKESSEVWAQNIIAMAKRTKDMRQSQEKRITEKGFNIKKEVMRIERIYGLSKG